MPGCLTSRTVGINSVPSRLTSEGFDRFFSFRIYHGRHRGDGVGPICTLITIHHSNAHLSIFVVTNIHLCSATAIIFLAPISAFDQYLEEDPRTNRIDDSLQLFTSTCSNKLLKNSNMVLMLNKTDILKKKLQAGVMVKK
jgi:hypothetical protein